MATQPDIHNWTFASGRAAALEARMLPAGFFEQIIEMLELDDVFYSLTDTPMRDEFAHPEEMQDADPKVNAFYGGMVEELRSFSPAPEAIDALRLDGDLRGLKNFVKRRFLDMEISPLASRYGDEAWERLWEGRPTEVPQCFQQVLLRPREVLASQPERCELFEAAFDSARLRALCHAAQLTGCPFIAEYFRRYDTAKGVELLWRARMMESGREMEELFVEGRQDGALFHALVQADPEDWPALLASAMPGLETDGLAAAQGAERIQAFEAQADAWLMGFAHQAQYVAFGPERVFGCAVGLLAEADNLSLAIGGRANGIAPGLLRQHLRTCYV